MTPPVYWTPVQIVEVEEIERRFREEFPGGNFDFAELARAQSPRLAGQLRLFLATKLPYNDREDWIRESIRSAQGVVKVQEYLDLRADLKRLIERLAQSPAHIHWVSTEEFAAMNRDPSGYGVD